jgi:hypothetical protein
MSKRILVALLFECKEKQSFKSAKLTKDIWLSIQPRTEICPWPGRTLRNGCKETKTSTGSLQNPSPRFASKKGGGGGAPSLSIKAIKLHAVLLRYNKFKQNGDRRTARR